MRPAAVRPTAGAAPAARDPAPPHRGAARLGALLATGLLRPSEITAAIAAVVAPLPPRHARGLRTRLHHAVADAATDTALAADRTARATAAAIRHAVAPGLAAGEGRARLLARAAAAAPDLDPTAQEAVVLAAIRRRLRGAA